MITMYVRKSSIIIVTVLLCYYTSVTARGIPEDDIGGYYWRDYKGGAVPKDALPGGTNANGNPTYIGQILHNNLLIPAKIDVEQDKVTYEWGYKEYVTNQNVKILCTRHPEKSEWLHTGNGLIGNINPDILVIGGFEPGAKIYIGRKQIDNELVLGKVIQGPNQSTLNTSKNGTGTQHAEFDILSYNSDKKTINKTDQLEPLDIDVRTFGNSTSCNQHVTVVNVYNN